MKNKIIGFIFLTISSIAFSQKSDAFAAKNKYQIGISISKIMNNLFPSDKNSFLLESRISSKNDNFCYRVGANYDISTDEDGVYRMGVKLGLDKVFKQSKNWCFYYGVDLGYTHSYLKISKRHTGDVLLSPFLGVMYKFSEHFSISTEPNIYLVQKISIDNGTFAKDNKKYWFESGFGKVGFIQLNFHF